MKSLFPALSVYSRVGISWSALEIDDRLYLTHIANLKHKYSLLDVIMLDVVIDRISSSN